MLTEAEQNTVFCFLSQTTGLLKVGNWGENASITSPLVSQTYSCSHGCKVSLFPIPLTSRLFFRRKEERQELAKPVPILQSISRSPRNGFHILLARTVPIATSIYKGK